MHKKSNQNHGSAPDGLAAHARGRRAHSHSLPARQANMQALPWRYIWIYMHACMRKHLLYMYMLQGVFRFHMLFRGLSAGADS